MAEFSRLETLTRIKQAGMVPVFYNPDPDTCRQVAQACQRADVPVLEYTNRGDGAFHVFSQLAEFRRSRGLDITLGVGSVLDAATSAMYIGAGADFIVSPFVSDQVARVCNTYKVPYLPGCGSVSEIHRAHLLGAEICKLFPAQVIDGPAFIKAIRAPLPWAEIMPTGAISPTEQDLARWFEAGAVCVGMGSRLVSKELIEKGDFDELAERFRRTIELVAAIRDRLRKTKK